MVDAKTLGLAETYKHLGQALAAAESALVAALAPAAARPLSADVALHARDVFSAD